MRIKIGIVVLLVAIMASGCELLGALFPGTWEFVGDEGFSLENTDFVRVGIDEVDGVIYTAFQEGSLGSVSVMKYEEFGTETWEYVGGAQITGEEADYVALLVDDGTPYISFSDNTAGVDGGLSVMMFDGTDWSYVGGSAGGISAYGVTYSDMYVENGDVYVAYRENFTVDGLSNVRISMHDGSSWQPHGADPVVIAGSGGSDFVEIERYSGTTYVSFTDRDSNGASVISSTGGAWSPVGPSVISTGKGEFVSLAIDDGTLFVAFAEGTGALSVMSFDGAVWSYVGQAISDGLTSQVSMDFLDGTPIVAYKDHVNNFALSVQSMDRQQWGYVGEPGFSAGRADSVSLKAGNAAYYVAFTDGANLDKVTVVRYR